MYPLKSLPSFPTESPSAERSLRQPFVEDGVIAAIMCRQEVGWRDMRYIGEDFAGRDDCPVPLAATQPWPVRQACGAFFAPVTDATGSAIIAAAEPNTAEPSQEASIPLWRRSLAIASAAAILLSAALVGLWAAHSFAPQTSQGQPESSQHDATMVSQLRAH